MVFKPRERVCGRLGAAAFGSTLGKSNAVHAVAV